MTVTHAIENSSLSLEAIETFAMEPLSPEDARVLDTLESIEKAIINKINHYRADSSDVQTYLDKVSAYTNVCLDKIEGLEPQDSDEASEDNDMYSTDANPDDQFSGWMTSTDNVTLSMDNSSMSPEDSQMLYTLMDYHKGILTGIGHYKADSSDVQSFLDDTVMSAKDCTGKITDMMGMNQTPTDQKVMSQYANFASEGAPEYKWEGPIAFEGISTGDNRFFKPNSIEWDADSFPVPFRWQKSSVPGHTGAVPIGRVDRLERRDDGAIYGFGVIIPSLNDEAAEYLRLLESGVASGVSVDGDSAVFDVSEMANGQSRVIFSNMRVRSITAVDIPAFSDAQVDLVATGIISSDMSAIVASAIPVKPPIEWFEDQKLNEPTGVTVTKDGQVYGYLAIWNQCHIGFPGSCVSPPKNGSYKYFHTGELETDAGDLVEVGHLTFNTGHAGMKDSAKIAAAHYDHTGTVAADVRVGEDQHGIWVAGALRSHLDDEDLRAFRAAPLSGDWRRIAGKLELVGALAVNVPGFPVPRVRTLVASGETETLLVFQESEERATKDPLLRVKKIEIASRIATNEDEFNHFLASIDDDAAIEEFFNKYILVEPDMVNEIRASYEAFKAQSEVNQAIEVELDPFHVEVDDIIVNPSSELLESFSVLEKLISDYYSDMSVELSIDIDAYTETKVDDPYELALEVELNGSSQTLPPEVQAAYDVFVDAVKVEYGNTFNLDTSVDINVKDITDTQITELAVDSPDSYSIKKQFGKFCVANGKGMIVKGGCYKTNDEASAKMKAMMGSPTETADMVDYEEMATASYTIKKQFGKFCVANEKGMIVKGGCYPTNDEAAAKMKAMMGSSTETTAAVDETISLAEDATIKKTEGGEKFPASDYAYTPDKMKPSTWKLRLTSSPGGDPDPAIVGAAVAALGKGFMGNKVQLPEDAHAAVKAKVKAAWLKANPDKTAKDLPPVLKG